MSEAPIPVGMTPSHPGRFVRVEVLTPLGLSISRAAGILGVRRATLSDLVNAKTALTPEMALRLEKAFGLDLQMLLSMQAFHDAAMIRRRASDIAVERYHAA